MTTPLYHQLMDSPNVKLLLEKVQANLEAESESRKAFYEWLTPDIKAEFINGEIIVHSPVKRRHLHASKYLSKLLSTYVDLHDLGEVDVEKAMISLSRNDYEPDICFWKKEKTTEFHGDLMMHPAPDLIVEVLSKSTANRDRGVKFQDYAAHSVQEYWIVDPEQEIVEVCILDKEQMQYQDPKALSKKDRLRSHMVEGFDIPVLAIFDKKTNLATLKDILGP